MKTLVIKLGATGDVVRTTPLLRRIEGHVTWIVASKNRPLLEGLMDGAPDLRVLEWEDRSMLEGDFFDRIINLEDDVETAGILASVRAGRLFGAYRNEQNEMAYRKCPSVVRLKPHQRLRPRESGSTEVAE